MDYTNDRLDIKTAKYAAGYDAVCLFVNDTANSDVLWVLSMGGVKLIAMRCADPKYRVADSEQYPLADIEIERIFRQWNRQFGSRSDMSSAGFFSGITVDGAADAFAPGR